MSSSVSNRHSIQYLHLRQGVKTDLFLGERKQNVATD